MGVALCAVFSIDKDVANPNDVMDSKSSYKLICHLKASNGLSVKPRHIYWPTKEDLKMTLLGKFTWLTYIPRGSFPDWLCDCASVKFSFKTNCHGLKVQKCGLRVLYQNSVEKFKNCMNSKSDISAILNQKKLENENRKMRSLIRNELGKNDTPVINNYVVFLSQTRYSISLSLISLTLTPKNTIFLFHRALIDAFSIIPACLQVKFWSGSIIRAMSPG